MSERFRRTQDREVRNYGARKECGYEVEEEKSSGNTVPHGKANRQLAFGAQRRASALTRLLPDRRPGHDHRGLLDDVHLPAFPLYRFEFSAGRLEVQTDAVAGSEFGIAARD